MTVASLVTGKSRTPEQRASWTETDLNWHMRQALMEQGFRAIHIREANEPGVFDLAVYERLEVMRAPFTNPEWIQELTAWLELKMDRPSKPAKIEVSQKEFGRDHWPICRNAMFCTYVVRADALLLQQGDLKGRIMEVSGDPYAVDWRRVFAKFKSRKS